MEGEVKSKLAAGTRPGRQARLKPGPTARVDCTKRGVRAVLLLQRSHGKGSRAVSTLTNFASAECNATEKLASDRGLALLSEWTEGGSKAVMMTMIFLGAA